jgi:acyl-CoA thioester hydrolase
MKQFVWPVRVYHEDTDGGGVVYYANYLKFMERARTEWLREIGIEQTKIKQRHNLIFAVRKLSIDYLKPALFDDLLQVTSHLTHMGKVSMTMNQQISRDEGTLLCKAEVKIASINTLNQRPLRLPTVILKILTAD